MEEKKTKTVKMNPSSDGSEHQEMKQRLSYEQLNETCSQLYQQNQAMRQQLQQMNMAVMFKRLECLFKVLELRDKFDNQEFVERCEEEVTNALTPPEDKEGLQEN